MNINSNLSLRILKLFAASVFICIAPSFAFASADGCVGSDGYYSGGTFYVPGVSSCVDVRGHGLKIDSLRGGGKVQAGVAVWGTVYITMPNGAAFFTPVQLFDNTRGLQANTKWSTFYTAGYAVPKGKVCAYFYEWDGAQWITHNPACVDIK
jgi:hypothetical protein